MIKILSKYIKKVSNEDILAASKIKEELEKLSNERESEKFGDNDIDLKYLKKMQQDDVPVWEHVKRFARYNNRPVIEHENKSHICRGKYR